MVTLAATAMSASLVSAASEFLPYAELLADNAVISTQTTESGYRLGDNITRAELAKVVANLGGIDFTECTGTVYGDVNSKLGDLCGYVEALANAGVVTKANANFRPLAPVTRAEMTKMILAALGKAPSTTSAGYQDVTASLGDLAGYINTANEMGCAKSATYFRVNATSTRGETFKIAACAAELDVVTPPVNPGTSTGTTSTGTTATGTVTTTGALTVALDGTAVAQYVPKNASSVKVGSVKLSAGPQDVTVNSLTVARSGLGRSDDITTIRAAQNGSVVSSNSDYYNSISQKGNIYFFPALVIKAGTSTSVDILASLSGAENSQHQFTLETVNSNATVSGLPVTLGLLNTTSYLVGNVSVAGSNSYTVNPGNTQQNFAKVDITAGNRDVVLNGFTLTRSGGTDLTRCFANVNVYMNGSKVGTVAMSSDKIIVSGLNTKLSAGNFQSYELRGDALVDGSNSNNRIGFMIQNSSDVSATEVATNYSTQTTGVPSTGLNISTVTFNAVNITFVNVTTADQTVSPGTSNVTLYNGKVTSTVPFTVKQLTITPAMVSPLGATAFANGTLSVRVNGSEIATITSSDYPANSTAAIVKNISFPVDANTPATITIVASSVLNNTTVSGDYKFTVALTDVRDAANNVVPLNTTNTNVGYKTTIQAPVLTVQNSTVAAPTNRTISNTTNQEVGRFGLRAATSDINVSKLTLALSGTVVPADLLTKLANTSSIQLWDVATNQPISASVNVPAGTSTIVFDSMTYLVKKDTTNNVKVVFTNVNDLSAYFGTSVQFDVNIGVTSTSGGGVVTCATDSGGNIIAGTCQTVAPSTNTSTANIAANAVNGPQVSVQKVTGFNMAQYTIGLVPPTLLVTPNSPLTQNARIATVRVTNTDSNTGITLSGVTVQFAARSTANGSFTFAGNLCLRDMGSSNACGAVGTTAPQVVTQAGGTFNFPVTGLSTNTLDKNGGYVEYEVYLDGAPLWVAGDNANVTITSLKYLPGGANGQSYVGVSGASATATK
jgi:hypothetical protein